MSKNNNYYCNANYTGFGNYYGGITRNFSEMTQSTQPVVLSNWGGLPNDFDLSGSSGGNSVKGGYSTLQNSYKQTNLFSGPYSARMCLKN
jgi:hypothetical protein